MKVFIVNGYPRAGKDSFVDFCSEYAYCTNYSTVDIIKLCATLLGWDGVKDGKSRKFLSDLKDLASNAFDTSMQQAIKEMLYADFKGVKFFFIHAREPQEIDEFKKVCTQYLHFICKTIYISRPGALLPNFTNHSDAEVMNYEYDVYLENDGTLEDWKQKAFDFIDRETHLMN